MTSSQARSFTEKVGLLSEVALFAGLSEADRNSAVAGYSSSSATSAAELAAVARIRLIRRGCGHSVRIKLLNLIAAPTGATSCPASATPAIASTGPGFRTSLRLAAGERLHPAHPEIEREPVPISSGDPVGHLIR